MIAGWRHASQPGWALSFDHPDVDAAGRPVVVEGTPDGAPFERIHVMGVDRDEIYFEVRRRVGRTAAEGHAIARQYLPEQYPGATVSDLVPCEVGGHPAQECTARWDDQERRFVFVEAEGAMYRIVFRPRSDTNHAILASVRVGG